MNVDLRKFARFVLQFVPLFALCLWLYVKIVPKYEPLVLGVANAVAERMRPSTRLEQQAEGGWTYTVFTPETGLFAGVHWGEHVPHLLLLGLALLPALLLATPAPWRVRLRLLALGLPLLFVVHVLSALALMRETECLRQAPGTFHCLWILRAVYASGQIFAAALWLVLSWRHWLPRR